MQTGVEGADKSFVGALSWGSFEAFRWREKTPQDEDNGKLFEILIARCEPERRASKDRQPLTTPHP
jgi:hypothetical protein